MSITEITKENVNAYTDHFPADFADEIEREYYRGLVGEDEETSDVTAVVFWELRNAEDDNLQTEAEILWFSAKNAEDGAALLKEIEEVPEVDDVKRLYYEMSEIGSVEQEAFSAAGFSAQEAEGRDVCVTVEELSKLKLSLSKIPDYIKPLKEISSQQFKAGIMTSVFHGKYGLLEDLPFLPITRFDPDLSCCMITDEKVNALLLVHQDKTGTLRVELLFAMQPDANVHLLNMMRYAIRTASGIRSPEDRVLLRRHNKATVQLVGKLFPGRKGASVVRGDKRCTHEQLF